VARLVVGGRFFVRFFTTAYKIVAFLEVINQDYDFCTSELLVLLCLRIHIFSVQILAALVDLMLLHAMLLSFKLRKSFFQMLLMFAFKL